MEVCNFKLAPNVVRVGLGKLAYDLNKPAILIRDLVRWCVDDNWWIWVRDCGGETVSLYADKGERETGGFLQCKEVILSSNL